MSLIADLTTAPGPGAVLSGALVPDGAVSAASEIGRQRPIILLRPASTAEVSAALAICHRHGQAVVPQGGMTGLSGGAPTRARAKSRKALIGWPVSKRTMSKRQP